MTRDWLKDPLGGATAFVDFCAGEEAAIEAMGHLVWAGQVWARGERRELVGTNELAMLAALELEARTGANLQERYRTHGEGCDQALYTRLMEAVQKKTSPRVAQHFAKRGFTLTERIEGEQPEASWFADLGRDFS